MLIKIIKMLIPICLLMNFSCKENPVDDNMTRTFLTFVYGGHIENDTNQVASLLYHISGIDYETVAEPRYFESYFLGYFTDGYNFVNPNNVSINNIPFSNCCDNKTGYFAGIVEMNSTNNFIANWTVNNYLGKNWSISQETASPMYLTNFNCIDTISKSTGITINYTGFIDNETIYIDIQYDAPLTELFLGASRPDNLHTIFKEALDNGNLQILPEDLALQPVNCYYYLRFYHEKKYEEIINGVKILKYSRYSTNVPFYLSN